MNTAQHISDDGDLRRYFAQIPHIADDDLDPYQYRLYGHYKRVCGTTERECKEYTSTTAKITKMSLSKVKSTRKWLAENGWISLKTQGETGEERVYIRVLDRWKENFNRYSPQLLENWGDGHQKTTSPSPKNHRRRTIEGESIKENGGGNSSLASDNPSPPPLPAAAVSETDSTALRPNVQEIVAPVIEQHEKTKAQEVREYQARETEILAAFGRLNKAIVNSNKGYQPITGTRKLAEQLARRGETEASMKAAWETCKTNGIKPMGAFMKWIQEGYLPPQQEGHETQVIDGVVCVWVDGQGWMATGGKAQ